MHQAAGPSRFPVRRTVFLVVGALVVFGLGFLSAVLIWVNVAGGVWRSEVSVREAWLRTPTELVLSVASCEGNPDVRLLEETDTEVRLKIIASSTPLIGGCDGVDGVEVFLRDPLGDRTLIDAHTGNVIRVEDRTQSSSSRLE